MDITAIAAILFVIGCILVNVGTLEFIAKFSCMAAIGLLVIEFAFAFALIAERAAHLKG